MSVATALRDKVLSYWFKGLKRDASVDPSMFRLWFGASAETDLYIQTEFSQSIRELQTNPEFQSELTNDPQGAVAAIILLDQFTRNAFRKSAAMFAYDPLARSIATAVIEKKWDLEYHPVMRGFIYLPFEHSEDIKDQEISVQLYTKLDEDIQAHPTDSQYFAAFGKHFLQYSVDHQAIIAKFGRYPHRNEVLDRTPTQEEVDYLANGGQKF